MSQENVELVIKMHPAPDVNMAELFGNDDMWAALAERLAPFFHTDFECVAPGLPHTERVHVGMDGFRAAWRAWLQPWLTYRTEIKQTFDAGGQVLVLVNDYGRREGSTEEIKIDGSGVWTVRDGKIARTEFFALRAEAFEAAGLEE